MKENQTNIDAKKKGREIYNSTVLWAKREKRNMDAIKRDGAYQSLSVKDRITRAQSRPGESKREIARLQKQLAAAKVPAVAKIEPLTEAQKTVKAVKRAKSAVARIKEEEEAA